MKTGKAIPKYMELAKWIYGQIQENDLRPGQKLHSENELREMFGVSRQTVRRALNFLLVDHADAVLDAALVRPVQEEPAVRKTTERVLPVAPEEGPGRK